MAYRVLLVDDDQALQEELKESLKDFEVLTASGGNRALETINANNEIDLVVLDIKMPGEQGTDILKKIRSARPQVGIIMLTAYSTIETAINSLKGRADDYLEKPVGIEDLITCIDTVLKKK